MRQLKSIKLAFVIKIHWFDFGRLLLYFRVHKKSQKWQSEIIKHAKIKRFNFTLTKSAERYNVMTSKSPDSHPRHT
jgi:hypothetical protein